MKIQIFTAPWCKACKQYIPKIEEILKNKNITNYDIIDCNEEKNREIVERSNITSVPHIIVYKNNDIIYNNSGTINLSLFINVINEYA